MSDSTHYAAGTHDNGGASRAEWSRLIAELLAVEAIPADETTAEHIEQAGSLISAIMAMPAPHNEALQWKLDFLLTAVGSECTNSYSTAFVAQTVADYRRILGAGNVTGMKYP